MPEREAADDTYGREAERFQHADSPEDPPWNSDGVGERELPPALAHGGRDRVVDDEATHDEGEEARGRQHHAQ